MSKISQTSSWSAAVPSATGTEATSSRLGTEGLIGKGEYGLDTEEFELGTEAFWFGTEASWFGTERKWFGTAGACFIESSLREWAVNNLIRLGKRSAIAVV